LLWALTALTIASSLGENGTRIPSSLSQFCPSVGKNPTSGSRNCQSYIVFSKAPFIKQRKMNIQNTVYNPSYSGGGDRIMVRGQHRQKLERPYLKNKPDLVMHIYNPSYIGGRGKKIPVGGWPMQAKAQDPI
jgi:hypothetical protein